MSAANECVDNNGENEGAARTARVGMTRLEACMNATRVQRHGQRMCERLTIDFFEIPVSGCTCLSTLKMYDEYDSTRFDREAARFGVGSGAFALPDIAIASLLIRE